MSHILSLAGHPTATPSSTAILEYIHQYLGRRDINSHTLKLRCLPTEPLLHANAEAGSMQDAAARVAQADGIIISSPVFKSSYPAVLKAYLDILPNFALRDKVILPIVTGSSAGQMLMLEYALKPVLSTMGANHILDGVFLTESQVQYGHGGVLHLEESAERRIERALQELIRETNNYSYLANGDWVI